MFSFDNFASGLRKISTFDVKINNDCVVLYIPNRFLDQSRDIDEDTNKEIVVAELSISEIEDMLKKLGNSGFFQESFLFMDSSMEVAVHMLDSLRSFPPRPDRFSPLYGTENHGVSFELSKASAIYLLALLCYSSSNENIKLDTRFPFFCSNFRSNETIHNLNEFLDLFRIYSIKISSFERKKFSAKIYKRMLYSYIFNISYNFSVALSISDFKEDRRLTRSRTRRNGQLFPYKSYNQKLTKYYYQAVATDMPFAQYLAFYHVAEFFFQSISEEDAFTEIAEFITKPSFSPHAKSDIKRFYNMIRKKLREQRDDGVWNEKKGLLLCLRKYVSNLALLKDAIQVTDSSAIDYYKENLVEFADDSKIIDFDDNEEVIYANIRDRIYSIRNAIVHSKEGEKLRYEPFIHDKQLLREIPLIRCVAEEIIINSADNIGIEQND